MFDIPAHIRTYVPIFVMWLVSAAADAGVVISDDLSITMTATIAGVISAVYYAIVRAVAQKYPWVERFLIVGTPPTYTKVSSG